MGTMRPINNGKIWLIGLWGVLVGAVLACASAASAPSAPSPVTVTPVAPAAPVRPSAGLATLDIGNATIDPERRRPQGTLTVGLHYAHSPMWLDPQAYNSPVFNHFLYIVHDALIKPMAGNVWTYSLAEYAEMPNDYTYAKFRLREGLTFHDGTPLTTEDVKWSFEHYQGINSNTLKDKTARIEVLDDRTITFHFKEPFLDFLDLYAVVGGAAWVVPRHYYAKVGGEAFKQRPIGAGPFKFVSMEVGVEMVFEAWEDYWRKVPHVKTLKILGIRDPTAQWAALQTGEVDVAYLVPSRVWPQVFADPRLQWDPNHTSPWFLVFPGYQDPGSPFHDRRVREAVSLAINREFINQQEIHGLGVLHGNWIGPDTPDALRNLPLPEYDPEKAKHLLAQAGYPNGFTIAGYEPLPPFFSKAERIVTDLQAIGISGSVTVMEGPGHLAKLSKGSQSWPGGKTIVESISNNPGNAAHYISRFALCDGAQSFVCHPEIEALWAQYQASLDPEKRTQILYQVQRLLVEEFFIIPLYINAFLHVAGPNVTGNIHDYYRMPQAWGPWPFEEWQVAK